jgi:hypothetical protein
MGSDWLAGAASIEGAVAIAVMAARRLSALLWRFGLSVISSYAWLRTMRKKESDNLMKFINMCKINHLFA